MILRPGFCLGPLGKLLTVPDILARLNGQFLAVREGQDKRREQERLRKGRRGEEGVFAPKGGLGPPLPEMRLPPRHWRLARCVHVITVYNAIRRNYFMQHEYS